MENKDFYLQSLKKELQLLNKKIESCNLEINRIENQNDYSIEFLVCEILKPYSEIVKKEVEYKYWKEYNGGDGRGAGTYDTKKGNVLILTFKNVFINNYIENALSITMGEIYPKLEKIEIISK